MRSSLPASWATTQIEPKPAATPSGPAPVLIVATTSPVAGSSRTSTLRRRTTSPRPRRTPRSCAAGRRGRRRSGRAPRRRPGPGRRSRSGRRRPTTLPSSVAVRPTGPACTSTYGASVGAGLVGRGCRRAASGVRVAARGRRARRGRRAGRARDACPHRRAGVEIFRHLQRSGNALGRLGQLLEPLGPEPVDVRLAGGDREVDQPGAAQQGEVVQQRRARGVERRAQLGERPRVRP